MKDKYKTLITSCWVVLLCCFIVKLLGGNFFVIVCENENYKTFANFFNKGVPYWIISILSYTVSTTIYFMAVLKQNKPKLLIIVLCACFIIAKLLLIKYNSIMFIIEFIFLVLVPIFYNHKIWLRSLIAPILAILFQVISLITKNVGVKILYDNVINLIFMIDYYIMLILYWLYSIKEEENGKFRNFLFRFRRQRKHQ